MPPVLGDADPWSLHWRSRIKGMMHFCRTVFPPMLIQAAFLVALITSEPPSHVLLDGDLVFHQSRSSQSRVIQLLTESRYTHVGMVYFQKGKPWVFEASRQVRLTPLKAWVERGVRRHLVVKRLKTREAVLSNKVLEAMKAVALGFHGRPYDARFLWSDTEVYCSELVWKIYHRGAGIRLAKLRRFSDFPLVRPEVKDLVRRRYEGPVRLKEKVISPAALLQSPLLHTVWENEP